MTLKRGYEEEYKRRHDAIWPELRDLLYDAGILHYAIYLDEKTGSLFAVQQLAERSTVDQLSDLPVMKRWWEHMKDIMEVNPDNSPIVVPLKPMFELTRDNK